MDCSVSSNKERSSFSIKCSQARKISFNLSSLECFVFSSYFIKKTFPAFLQLTAFYSKSEYLFFGGNSLTSWNLSHA